MLLIRAVVLAKAERPRSYVRDKEVDKLDAVLWSFVDWWRGSQVGLKGIPKVLSIEKKRKGKKTGGNPPLAALFNQPANPTTTASRPTPLPLHLRILQLNRPIRMKPRNRQISPRNNRQRIGKMPALLDAAALAGGLHVLDEGGGGAEAAQAGGALFAGGAVGAGSEVGVDGGMGGGGVSV